MALAIVATGCVEADGVGSAGVAHTFVDVLAADVGVSLEADWTDAIDAVDALLALGVGTALGGVAAVAFLSAAAQLVWVA